MQQWAPQLQCAAWPVLSCSALPGLCSAAVRCLACAQLQCAAWPVLIVHCLTASLPQVDPANPPAARDWGALLAAADIRPGITGKTINGVYSGRAPEAELAQQQQGRAAAAAAQQ